MARHSLATSRIKPKICKKKNFIWYLLITGIRYLHTESVIHGHKLDAKTGTEIQTGRKKERGTTEEEMEGPTPLWGLRSMKNAWPLMNMMMMSFMHKIMDSGRCGVLQTELQWQKASNRWTSLRSTSIIDRQWIPKTHKRREVTIMSNGIRFYMSEIVRFLSFTLSWC